MWDRHPASLSLLHMVPDLARSHGLATEPLLLRAGIAAHAAFDASTIVSRAQACTILDAFARQAGQPTIGLDLADAAAPERLGLTGQSLLRGRTLRECLFAHARHMPSLQAGVRFRLQIEGDMATWSHHLEDSDPTLAFVLNDGAAGFMTRVIRAILGFEAPLHICLPHRPLAAAHRYEDALRADVSFAGGGAVEFRFDAALLERPNMLAGPPLVDHLNTPSGPDAVRWPDKAPMDEALLVASLLRIFDSASLSGTLSLPDAARTLGFSPRSLQRRLAPLGMSFEALLDQWRQSQAVDYLRNTGLPVSEVAMALGYSHPAHFIRAFRRWYGITPLAFRLEARNTVAA